MPCKRFKGLDWKDWLARFIISFPALPDDIIVVECKADSKFHESTDGENPSTHAVDGALHYSAFLSKEYNVIAIAVSGSKLGKLKVSSFYQKMGQPKVSPEAPNYSTYFLTSRDSKARSRPRVSSLVRSPRQQSI